MFGWRSTIDSLPVTRKSSGMTFAPYWLAELARNVAVDAAVVDVVAAADQDQSRLAGLVQASPSLASPASSKAFLKLALGCVGRVDGPVAGPLPHAETLGHFRHGALARVHGQAGNAVPGARNLSPCAPPGPEPTAARMAASGSRGRNATRTRSPRSTPRPKRSARRRSRRRCRAAPRHARGPLAPDSRAAPGPSRRPWPRCGNRSAREKTTFTPISAK